MNTSRSGSVASSAPAASALRPWKRPSRAPCMPAPSTACVRESMRLFTLAAVDACDDVLFVYAKIQSLRIVFHRDDVIGAQGASHLGMRLLARLFDKVGADLLPHRILGQIRIAG